MGLLQRRLLIFVLSVVRHPRITLLLVGLTLGGCIAFSALTLTITSDQNKLFSPKVPFFHDYLELIRKFPENEAVYIVVEPKNPKSHDYADWTALADRITAKLLTMKATVLDAECRVPLEQLGQSGVLFDPPKQLQDDRQAAVQLAKLWGEKPGVVESLAGKTPIERFLGLIVNRPDDQSAEFSQRLCASWQNALDGNTAVDMPRILSDNPSRLGYFFVPNALHPEENRILVRVYPHSNHNSLTGVTETVDSIRDAANEVAKDFPNFQIGVTGRPALEADEMRITDIDSHHAEIAALIAVFIGLVVVMRSFWMALAAEIALGVGIGWTFGWATITVGQLNLLSIVFLIALIGIGMDYLVQILSRYRREARLYQRPDAVWVRVFRHVGPPINTACLGAAGAFFVAVFTYFAGAAELGIIAGGGLILCLFAGYTVLPAMMTIFPPRFRPVPAERRYSKPRPAKPFILILPALWIIALAALGQNMFKPTFFAGLIELQPQNLPSVRMIRTLQTWMAIIVTPDVDTLRALRLKMATVPQVASTESALDAENSAAWLDATRNDVPQIKWIPPDAVTPADLKRIADKANSLADHFKSPQQKPAVNALRALAVRLGNSDKQLDADRLSQWQENFVHALHDMIESFKPAPFDLHKVIAGLPPALRGHLMDEEGEYTLYIYPKDDLWDQTKLEQFVPAVQAAARQVPNSPPVTGVATDVFLTKGAIHDAFVHSTIYAFCLIFLLVLLDFRKLSLTLAAISVLGFGLPMLLVIMGLNGVDWNFANFFGLPILIGAGHEYGVFMVHRYVEAKKYPRRVWKGWDVSDRALMLCGYITSASFGFFWLLAHHLGLKSLGWVMAVGTGCIYFSTVLVLRPILRWRLSRISAGQDPH